MARLASELVVKALIRRVFAEGGTATVLARGEEQAGGILVLTLDRGADPRFFEAGLGPAGTPELLRAGPAELADENAVQDYWQKRRSRDPDLWVVELDIARGERFAAEIILNR